MGRFFATALSYVMLLLLVSEASEQARAKRVELNSSLKLRFRLHVRIGDSIS